MKNSNPSVRLNKFNYSFLQKLNPHAQEIVKGMSLAFILRIMGALLNFGFSLALARALGAEGAGQYFLVLAVISIATVIGRIGLDNAIIRFISAGAAANDSIAVKGVYTKGIKYALLGSTTVALLVYLFAPWLSLTVFSKPELSPSLRWMSPAIVFWSIVFIQSSAFRGLKRISDGLIPQFVGIPLIAITIFLSVGILQGVRGAIYAFLTGTGLMAFYSVSKWWRSNPDLKRVRGKFDTRKLFRSSIPLFWVTTTYLVLNRTSVIMLGIFGPSADVGIFSLAHRTALFVSFILMAGNSIIAPKFSELYSTGRMNDLASTARYSIKLMQISTLPILLLIACLPEQIMSLFGQDFVGGAYVLVVLGFSQFINAAVGPVGTLLMMTGNEKSVRNSVVVAAALNLVLNYILIKYLHLFGAALASGLSLIVLNIFYLVEIPKRLNISILYLLGLHRSHEKKH